MTLQELFDEVTAGTTTGDSAIALIESLRTQVADLLSGANIPPAVQAQVDAVFTTVAANRAKLEAALVANVPIPTP